jgi:hypothetical protein
VDFGEAQDPADLPVEFLSVPREVRAQPDQLLTHAFQWLSGLLRTVGAPRRAGLLGARLSTSACSSRRTGPRKQRAGGEDASDDQ